MKRLYIVVCVLLVAAACAGEPTRIGSTEIRYVKIDGHTNRFNGTFFAFFPRRVTVRQGDRVVFLPEWTGTPHTATLGTLAGDLIDGRPGLVLAKLGPDALPPSAMQPCYLQTGSQATDGITACPLVRKPAFNGTQTVYGTGFIAEGERFTVPIGSDTQPGRYRYVCSFHGPAMNGEIEVVARASRIPSQSDVDNTARDELSALVKRTLPVLARATEPYKRVQVGHFPYPARAGAAVPGEPVAINEFVPFTIKAKRNEKITWAITGGHSISFKAPRNSGPPAIEKLQTGEVQPVSESLLNVGSNDPPRGALTGPVEVDGRRYNKQGTRVSGFLDATPPGLLKYAIRLTEPGTYRYACLVHPRMTGIVTVAL